MVGFAKELVKELFLLLASWSLCRVPLVAFAFCLNLLSAMSPVAAAEPPSFLLLPLLSSELMPTSTIAPEINSLQRLDNCPGLKKLQMATLESCQHNGCIITNFTFSDILCRLRQHFHLASLAWLSCKNSKPAVSAPADQDNNRNVFSG